MRRDKNTILASLTGLVFVITLIFMITRNYFQLRDALIENEQRHLLTIVDTAAKSIENQFEAEQRSLNFLSRDIEFQKEFQKLERGGESSVESLKIYYKSGYPRIQNIELIDWKGNHLTSYPKKKGKEIEVKQSLDRLIEKRSFVLSEVYFEDEKPYINLFQPVIIDGMLHGAIKSKMSVGYIYEKFIKPIKSGKKGYASIKTSDGVFIMHPKKNQIGRNALEMRKALISSYDWKELENLFREQETGVRGARVYHSAWVTDKNPKVVKKFNAYSPIKLQDDFWIVTLSTDYAEVVDRVKKNYYSTIFISSTLILGFLMLGFYIYVTNEKGKRLERKASYLEDVKKLNTELERDIEKRKRLEEELLRTMDENREKEVIMIDQSRHAAMGEMIGNIAHQWRQPLSSLSLLVSNIEDILIYGEDDEEYKKNVFVRSRLIIENMSETIEDFRNFFKPNGEKETFNGKDILKVVSSILKERMKYHNIAFVIEIDKNVEIEGYFNQLCQVILNLINNSIDALIEEKGMDKSITLSIKKSEDDIVINVKDNGSGIPEKIRKNIFDLYFSTKKEKNGTGLGLHMSKMILERNFNGSIELVIEKVGANFEIHLPIEEKKDGNK